MGPNIVGVIYVPYHYTSLTDFLTNAPWGDGFHYVTVVAFDRTTRPVPATTTTGD